MVKKNAKRATKGSAKSKQPKAASAGIRGLSHCEQPIGDKPLQSEFYFLVKLSPANAPTEPVIEVSSTQHLTVGPAKTASGQKQYKLTVIGPEYEPQNAFKFVLMDLNENLDTIDGAMCVINSGEGKTWLKDAVDYAVFKVKIE